ncbi:zinc ribbon domain-containing protein [Marinicrinis lubricantis]|uniref:Zinc ribbon domain-containing protein n=1 Tax=Marinicrinis lubricantis TaxID=2086470 RepID=A0ABW1IKV9_9BACL
MNHPAKVIKMIAAAALIICFFMPVVDVQGSYRAIIEFIGYEGIDSPIQLLTAESDEEAQMIGTIFLALPAIGVLILVFHNKRMLGLVLSMISGIFSVAWMFILKAVEEDHAQDYFYGPIDVSPGIGIYLALIASIVVIITSFVKEQKIAMGSGHPSQVQPQAQMGIPVKRFCGQCGKAANPSSQFCGHCGSKM